MNLRGYFKKVSFHLALLTLAFLACILLFGYLVDEVIIEKEVRFDVKVSDFMTAHFNASLSKFMEVITFFGSREFLLAAYAAVIMLYLYKKHKRLVMNIAAVGILGAVIITALKKCFSQVKAFVASLKPDEEFQLSQRAYGFRVYFFRITCLPRLAGTLQ